MVSSVVRWVGATDGEAAEALWGICGCARVDVVRGSASEVETDSAGSVSLFLFAEEERVERFDMTVVRRVSSCAWDEPLSVEQVE